MTDPLAQCIICWDRCLSKPKREAQGTRAADSIRLAIASASNLWLIHAGFARDPLGYFLIQRTCLLHLIRTRLHYTFSPT